MQKNGFMERFQVTLLINIQQMQQVHISVIRKPQLNAMIYKSNYFIPWHDLFTSFIFCTFWLTWQKIFMFVSTQWRAPATLLPQYLKTIHLEIQFNNKKICHLTLSEYRFHDQHENLALKFSALHFWSISSKVNFTETHSETLGTIYNNNYWI